MHPLGTKGCTHTRGRKGIALKGQKVRLFLKELKFWLQAHPRTLFGLGGSRGGLPCLAKPGCWITPLSWWAVPSSMINFLLNTSLLSWWWTWKERQKGAGRRERSVWTPEESGRGNTTEHPISNPVGVWRAATGTTETLWALCATVWNFYFSFEWDCRIFSS